MKDPIDKSGGGGGIIIQTYKDPNSSQTNLDSHLMEACDSLGDLGLSNGARTTDSLAVSAALTESVRSSTSSLARSETSDTPQSALRNPLRASSAQAKKVSICSDPPSSAVKREQTVSPSGERGSAANRTSLIEVSGGRKAKKVRFFINGDKFFKGAVIAVNNEKFRTFEKLLEHLTRIMVTQVTLPQGVRTIFNLDGKVMSELDVIQNGESYVCSSTSNYKKLDYNALGG